MASLSAQAENCSDYPNGLLDGAAGTVAPSQLQIDRICTIRNYPASNPLSTNFSFLTQPGQTDERWIVIFDNVVHTGQMACNTVAGHKIWFTNGSSTQIQDDCQNLLIPVEKIDKNTATGQTTASVGVPFTYRLTMPVLWDPATGTVINTSGSLNDLHGVTLTDDLNATGVDLTYVSHEVYWLGSGAAVAHDFSNAGGLLTFDDFPIIPAGEQIVIDVTVVLEDTPANSTGTQFVNVAKWDFGRLIDGVFYEPLPGEWGISPPITIAAPELVVTKAGPATLGRTLNLGEWGEFTIDVANAGLSEAWNAEIVDRLPNGPAGGMCDMTPELLNVQVYQSDGVTPVPGKGPLQQGVDFTASFADAPQCTLELTMLTAAAAIGSGERLRIRYRTRLDAHSQDGASLSNVAGATRWFNGAPGNPDRLSFSRPVTTGTPGVTDHQDVHTVTVALHGYFFEKTVANRTTGANPTTVAAPGDVLRYTLRLQATDVALGGIELVDDLGAMNPGVVFAPGTLRLVPGTVPPGADTSGTDPTGGTNGAGIVRVSNLNVGAGSEVRISFDVTVAASVTNGTVITNQADLISTVKLADSDDPNVNGQADPDVAGDEDPTRVLVEATPPAGLVKANTQATAAIGEGFRYRITVPSAPSPAPLYDVQILDDLAASAADLVFVDVTRISGTGSWTPQNTGSLTSLVIEDPVNGIDIPAGAQIVIEVTVMLADSPTNVAGLSFTNTASYTYNLIDGDSASTRPGEPGTSSPMTVVEPELVLAKSGPAQMREGLPGTFTLTAINTGQASAYRVALTDLLPNGGSGGMCDAAPDQVTARLFEADGVTPAGPMLTPGTDYSVAFDPAPACRFQLALLTTPIDPGQRLLVTYQASLDADTAEDAVLTNVAGVTEWWSVSAGLGSPQARRYAPVLTDGTVGVTDHQDAHTVVVFSGLLMFEKTVTNVTTGGGARATPGDRLRYSLRIENVGAVPVDAFSIVDELDRLNPIAAFQPGSLRVVTVPAGADSSATNAAGGLHGTGLLRVDDLSLANTGDTVLVEFEVTLAPVIANGSDVLNQSQMLLSGTVVQDSDDPTVNGAADPVVAGDEDPTRVRIESAPLLEVEKISADVSGDPNLLLPGETLRYTITVQNVGTDHATGVVLRDLLPANTTYLAGSTTLNGAAVADGPSASLPLATGISIHAPEDSTAGYLRADASGTTSNVATIRFSVVVDPQVIDGTIIANQAFVSALAGGIVDQPSDDPRTDTVNDPTRDVVGNLPLLYAEKSVALQTDGGSPGIVDPGDVLRYTIRVHNNGNVPANGVELADDVPMDVSYVADTLTLNGIGVGRPDGGVFPLAAGVPISSGDLTPPLPAPGEGTLSPQQTAVVQFDLKVDDGVAPGTLISNQALVTSAELGNLPTDGDGNPATGPEPTVVVVGDVQQLAITKQVAVVGGGSAVAGSTLEYLVRVTNIGAVPAQGVIVTDDLDEPVPGQLAFVDGTWTMNGMAGGIGVAGPVLTADYSDTYGSLHPGEAVILRFQAVLDPDLAIGTTVTNTAHVTWNSDQTAYASVAIDVGGMPGVGLLNGTVWHDADFDDQADEAERLLEGWSVELYRNDQRVHATTTDADGSYQIAGVAPNYLSGDAYSIRFLAPGAAETTALLGEAHSDFTNALQRISDIVVQSGSNLQRLDLPLEPNGVVYDSVLRLPIADARLRLLNAATGNAVPAGCLEDPAQQGQVTLGGGYYKFDLNFSAPGCPGGGSYLIEVTEPASGYVGGVSEIIPPGSADVEGAFDVPACTGSSRDAVAATAERCEAQSSEHAPGSGVEARSAGTRYYVNLILDDSAAPGSSQIFNNHIPLDPILEGAVFITKTTPFRNVVRGQQVPYTITVSNTFGIDLRDVTVVDRYPPGFRYVEGSARIDGVPAEPALVGRELHWVDLELPSEGRSTLRLLLTAGAGVAEGDYVNRAQAVNTFSGNPLSGEATATVRIVPDPTFDCTDVMGKVFDDANRNGIQDTGEAGLPGVRLATVGGLIATTDQHGRYHITCAVTPREDRGSNFVLKLDDRTLPSGYRSSTDTAMVQRATRGKALRLNFGASIHRVVGLDVADAVFAPGSTDIRPQWVPRFALLMRELEKAPAVLRVSYLADTEDPDLVEQRLAAVRRRITDAWAARDCCYRLAVETEVFWRLGGPPSQIIRRSGAKP